MEFHAVRPEMDMSFSASSVRVLGLEKRVLLMEERRLWRTDRYLGKQRRVGTLDSVM